MESLFTGVGVITTLSKTTMSQTTNMVSAWKLVPGKTVFQPTMLLTTGMEFSSPIPIATP